jgi:UDP-GlcNAc:undecaprenyl-phosphate GlcNAc-1-phosphate transferase
MSIIIIFCLSLTVASICTPIVKQIGLKYGFTDNPGQRKVHQEPIVRVGGIAICISTLIACLVGLGLNLNLNHSSSSSWQIIGVLAGGLLFFLLGLADDIFNLPPLPRLLLQGVVACFVWSLGVRVDYLPIPGFNSSIGLFSLPITFLWLVGVTNALNWSDGLDGLAAGISSIAAGLFALICWQHNPSIALIALALMGATVGFLYYNTNPASIFMGDGGSYFIGFTLASISAIGFMQQASFTQSALPYLMLAVPIVDMTRVIVSRLRNGKSPFFADQRHLHHRLLQAGLTVKPAVRLVWSLTLWVGSWAVVLAGTNHSGFLLLFSSALLLWMMIPLCQSLFLLVVQSPQLSRYRP